MHDKAVLHYVQTCKYIDVNPLKDPSAAHRPQLREPPTNRPCSSDCSDLESHCKQVWCGFA